MISNPYRCPPTWLLWAIAFVYALLMALLMQKVALPLLPSMQAVNGLLPDDPLKYHNIAVELAAKIRANGWQEWTLFPGAPANVGVLAALYALFGNEPAWFLPLNAAAHAAGAILVLRIGRRLWPGTVGEVGGLIAGTAFLVFPSALQWYGQNLKDAFSIAGTLLVLASWLDLNSRENVPNRKAIWLCFQAVIGTVVVGLCRPFFPVIIVGGLLASILVTAPFNFPHRNYLRDWKVRLFRVLFVTCAALVAYFSGHIELIPDINAPAWNIYTGGTGNAENKSLPTEFEKVHWTWHRSAHLPGWADTVLKRASMQRVNTVAQGRLVGAESEIDGDLLPDHALSAVMYAPRALMVGFLAPFPSTWTQKVSPPRLIGAIETSVWYLLVLGLIVTLRLKPTHQLFVGLVFCATIVTVLAYVHPNVGTLYRQRFAFWQFVMLCGTLGWVAVGLSLLQRQQNKLSNSGGNPERERRTMPHARRIDRVATAGIVFTALTLASYAGFFARDLLIMKTLGVGAQLDAFFGAMMIPVFVVSCFGAPMADALTTPFLRATAEAGKINANDLARRLLGSATLILGASCILTIVFSKQIMGFVLDEAHAEVIPAASAMLKWCALIVGLSAWTTIGNAVLNARHRSSDVALGQLFVPLVAIPAILIAPNLALVPFAAITGMIVGLALNIAWVFRRLLKEGILLVPLPPRGDAVYSALGPYRHLLAAAIIAALVIPLNYRFAAGVGVGGLSAWALASKIVLLFTGLASLTASAIVLPYIARLQTNCKEAMRSDSLFLIGAGMGISALVAVGMVVFADPLTASVFSGTLSEDQLWEFAQIVKIGILQLPIAIAVVLLTKVCIVVGASSRLVFSALAGLACNFAVNAMCVPVFGVLGVAIGVLAGTLLAALCQLFVVRRRIHLASFDVIVFVTSSLLWVGGGMILILGN